MRLDMLNGIICPQEAWTTQQTQDVVSRRRRLRHQFMQTLNNGNYRKKMRS